MDKLNQTIEKLHNLYKIEQDKKYKNKKRKQIKFDLDYDIKKFIKEKEECKKKNSIRLKSLRTKEKKEVLKNFDELYKKEEDKKFKLPWKKLNKILQKNRIELYFKEQKNLLKWSLDEYKKIFNSYLEKYEVNRLNTIIIYDEKNGKIIKIN
jgi:hypothetical protein